ncbi:hypothetical protein [Acidisoma sp.]|uniref:hypothetical protein n=1 Tax=Acidisoma sp. TaxID=1872115 RepID=UPI003AFF6ED3
MQPDVLPAAIADRLHQPELRLLLDGLDIRSDAELAAPFILAGPGKIVLGAPILLAAGDSLFQLRHAIELGWLAAVAEPPLAALAAARCAALAVAMETDAGLGVSLPAWVAPMTSRLPPDLSITRLIWARLARHQPSLPDPVLTEATYDQLVDAWALLGPSEWLMEQGGDARLATDPFTGLNGYGCSHRPRPWAITFASSTASSSSERGYLGAEAARRRMIEESFKGCAGEAVAAEAERVRQALARHFLLQPQTAVVLAASGTDAELIALALSAAAEDRPVTTILLAPEETGSGVPLAARGRHFGVDTALGGSVVKGDTVPGFRPDTTVVTVAVRQPDGGVRPAASIDAECTAAVTAAIAAGRRPILHVINVSKTGLRAPSMNCISSLTALYGSAMDVVVDACQTRLQPGTIRDYIGRGWMVQITGSKFFTGPPFSGALLAPAAVAARLAASALPEGLALYSGRPDWPRLQQGLDRLLPIGNHGLITRWQAALAEMQAFEDVPAARRRDVLHRFVAHVDRCIGKTAGLIALNHQPPTQDPVDWNATDTIRCFAIRRLAIKTGHHPPPEPDDGYLDLALARKIYVWLNADLWPALEDLASAADQDVLQRRCHVGQPVPIAISGRPAAALRVSAGARLVSGEPSLKHLDPDDRLERELSDVTILFRKLSLVLEYFDRLVAVSPLPSYA